MCEDYKAIKSVQSILIFKGPVLKKGIVTTRGRITKGFAGNQNSKKK